jgi:hypothetical protein
MENVFFIDKKNFKLGRRKRRMKFKSGYQTTQIREISLEKDEKLPNIANSSIKVSDNNL